MAEYLVTWTINIEAEDEAHAAQQALAIQRDPESIATVFEVREMDHDDVDRHRDVTIDLVGY
jgi:hypothetical protein